MVSPVRLFGSLASAAANLLVYGTVLALWPALAECRFALCRAGDTGHWMVFDSWRPFLDNPGAGSVSRGREAQCPEPRGSADSHDLVAAPLPAGYDPHAYGDRKVLACILVGADGGVLGARMLRGTGQPERDSALLGTIRRDWSFRSPDRTEPTPAWQRVRLNSGSVDSLIWDPPTRE